MSNRFRSPLTVLFLTAFIDMVGFGFTIPLLPFYAQRFGADGFHVTMISASFSLMQFLFVPVWGSLSDRIGRRPVLLTSILGTAVSMAMLGFANSYAMLLAARILQGVATANLATVQATIADVTTPENRARGMGMIGAAFGLGFILGPFFGGVLASYSHSLPGYAAAALALLNFAMAYFNLPESLPSLQPRVQPVLPGADANYRDGGTTVLERSPFSLSVALTALRRQVTFLPQREAWKVPGIALIVTVFFLQAFAFTNLESTFALFMQARRNYSERETGYLFGYIGLCVALVQGFAFGKLSRRFSEVVLARTGLSLLAVSMAMLALIPRRMAPQPMSFAVFFDNALPLLFVLGLSALGNAMVNPSMTALTSRRGKQGQQGSTLGVQQSTGALARTLGPLSAGLVFDRVGIAAPYAVGAAVMCVAVALTFRIPAQVDEAAAR